jgi:hypothetical protein
MQFYSRAEITGSVLQARATKAIDRAPAAVDERMPASSL